MTGADDAANSIELAFSSALGDLTDDERTKLFNRLPEAAEGVVSTVGRILERVGLISQRRVGRTRRCRLEPAPLFRGLELVKGLLPFEQEIVDLP